ncbi:bifunctional acetate--CoA ligase family protein/GNAT family N-acetyltransferase [Methylorubrum extorquens]|uniref:bifunctional acetate--CoA ligase family protein/GNAT family N-acetyltransferase n=1 Tax=Methylorubrum extorquens TaxID=408 RepID=UPI0020A0ADBA|nr:bifunctional acetate--CoA ligase family protein/GNAT family N-acetyltransferase [Methylorubrum extorquens]MCP1539281.1 acetyltransferase [Methylorubrum extorquens]
MSTYRFEALLAPRRIAVVGAGDRPGSVGRAIIDGLRAGGFTGDIVPVHPRETSVDGLACSPRLADIPQAPDLVMIATPPAAVPGIVEEAGQIGAAAAVILSAHLGVGEAAPAGAAHTAARRHGLRLIGPDSVGLSVPARGLNASLLARPPKPGDLALISQSGTVASAIAEWGWRHGVGFSAVMTLGRSADIDIADCLDHFAEDFHTRAIILSLHHITDARKFLTAARAAARAKPVVVLRTGRHDAPGRRPETHTGALARPGAVYEAAFRRAGLLAVDGLDAMFSAVETLGRQRPFPGNRLMIVSNGRGIGALAADRLADLGGTLAEPAPATQDCLAPVRHGRQANPLDLGIDAVPGDYVGALEPLLAGRDSDAIVSIHVPTARAGSREVAETVAGAVAKARSAGRRKPVFAVSIGEDEAIRAIYADAKIPLFATDADAVEGFLHLVRYREAQNDLMRTPDALPREFTPDVAAARRIVDEALAEGRTWLDPYAVTELLTAYRIVSVPVTLAPDPDGAAAAAWPLIAGGGTVVLKLVSPDVVHKSEVGGVRLGLTSEADVREAAHAMIARVRELRPDARVAGFAVQPMLRRPQGRELIAGLAEDPVFGPVVVFGRGGTAVEVIDDRALALPPLDLALASELIGRTRVARRLEAYRDVPAADLPAIALLLVKLAQLAADLPAVRELDINPLLADADGAVALDARVRIAPEPSPPERRRGNWHPRFAIRPYPSDWERRLEVGERCVHVRPVRPDDEDMFRAFFAQVDPEDVRLRFFAPVRDFSHAFLARLTQLDYSRAIAFVALDDAAEEDRRMLGAVRLHANANHDTGEFAILVRSDIKGTGLGAALMRMMIDWARAEGIAVVEGSVLAENRPMRAVCRHLGFVEKAVPDDPSLVKATLTVGG